MFHGVVGVFTTEWKGSIKDNNWRCRAGGVATSGNYRLCHRGFQADALAFNETAVKDHATNITVSDAITGDPKTISFGGQEAVEFPDELIYVLSLDINDGANTLAYNSALTTNFIPGFPAGSNQYTVTVFGVSVHNWVI